MKQRKSFKQRGAILMVLGAAFFPCPPSLMAQAAFRAWDVPEVVQGNHEIKEYGVMNDFEVVRPITVESFGAFDSEGDGIQGTTTITVQLFQRCGRKPHLLLETVVFDAADSGKLVGGFRFKRLDHPVTLLPGKYILTSRGFEKPDKDYSFEMEPAEGSYQPRMVLNDGGGLIRFMGCNRFNGGDPGRYSKQTKNIGPADRFAAATFTFSAAKPPDSPYATDYAILTAGVTSFPMDSGKSNVYGTKLVRNRYGSIALLDEQAFPLIVEPSGSRLIFAAAGTYNGDPNAARCVAFAHEQFGHALGDERMVLFENAIHWASRKLNPADIVLGVSTNMNLDYFISRGYQVRPLDRSMKLPDPNPMPGCDVLVIDLHGPYTERFMTRATEFVAKGGGLVVTYLPWIDVHRYVKPMFRRANALLDPFGMAYRASQTKPRDFGFTNLLVEPYPAALFSAFPAALLLRQEHLGQVGLSSLEKAVAMNTISYAADGNPEVLAALTAAYAGTPNSSHTTSGEASRGSFVDVATLSGVQANDHRVGLWEGEGSSLVAKQIRGGLEYDFQTPTADVYCCKIVGAQNLAVDRVFPFDLFLSVDGADLGMHTLQVTNDSAGSVEVLTPFLLAGRHSLRLLWDNPGKRARLRVESVHVQAAAGSDSQGDGIKDWVEALINAQSGLDLTNEALTSYVSPMCIEGRDPYPELMEAHVSGADENVPELTPMPAPNGRWYINVPLASHGDTVLQVSYQNGAKSAVRSLQWLPINVMDGGEFTIRKGDSLLLVAEPQGVPIDKEAIVHFTIGTNEEPVRSVSSPLPQGFYHPGTYTVEGTYSAPNGFSKSGAITVQVVDYKFAGHPACWVGTTRNWDVAVPSNVTLETDSRLFTQFVAQLPDDMWRTSLMIDQSEPRYLLARLGDHGPVLDSGAANGFRFWCSKDTYLRHVDTLPDGSELVEMMLVMSPVLPDVTVRLEVSVGGVVFEDGTLTKELTSGDFDARGSCIVRVIRPQNTKTSVCHSIKLFQNGTMIGQIW